jgi:hypothetical protein
MDIKTALDWPKVEAVLVESSRHTKTYQREVLKIIHNIGGMVSQLSKLELEARRSPFKSNQRVIEQLRKINTQIYELEQWLTLLMLY